MQRAVGLAILSGILAAGCATVPPATVYQNPIQVPAVNRDFLWDQLIDVVDDYFEIEREQRVRLEGDVLTIGRIDTVPTIASTLLEPLRRDSANSYGKLQSTLQSMRRRALVQVIPAEGGFLIDVAVFEELEDVPRPEFASAGAATLRHDSTQWHAPEPIGPQTASAGWIPVGRDLALEQRIIGQLLGRLGIAPPAPGRPRL